MAIQESIGLRVLPFGSYASDPGCFIHGRDYQIKSLPESYHGSHGPDGSAYFRVYELFPDNKFVGSQWAGRYSYVSKAREWLFAAELLGYPVMDNTSGSPVLCRNLPQPLDWGFNLTGTTTLAYSGLTVPPQYSGWTTDSGGGLVVNGKPPSYADGGGAYTGWTWQDTRGITNVRRPKMWATRIVKVEGVGGVGQNPDSIGNMWTVPLNSAGIPIGPIVMPNGIPPDECYGRVRFTVLFEQPAYEVMFSNGPYFAAAPGADIAFGGEYSRYVYYGEEPASKYVQIRGGATWDPDGSHYGQPTTLLSGTPFAAKEGLPIILGENMVTWKWIDVPLAAYNWGKIQGMFGKVNSSQFPPQLGSPSTVTNPRTSAAPFYAWGPEVALFRSAGRTPKNNVYGPPLWDITFYFHISPAPDMKGYWNRLLNQNCDLQRYFSSGESSTPGVNFFKQADFTTLFQPGGV